jgi:hypothetical protein
MHTSKFWSEVFISFDTRRFSLLWFIFGIFQIHSWLFEFGSVENEILGWLQIIEIAQAKNDNIILIQNLQLASVLSLEH